MTRDNPDGAPPSARSAPARVSPERLLGVVALGFWAVLFVWLLVTGRTALYLSSRTAWVVPVGAVIMCVALAGRLLSLRTRRPEPITARAALGTVLIVLPVVSLLALPPAALGSFAASRRATLVGAGAFGSSSDALARGPVSLFEVAGALRSRDGMRALAQRAGTDVTFVGFVIRPREMPADEFMLTRFLISCCAADALSIQVRVVDAPPGRLSADDWVRVRGKIYPVGREVVVEASDITRVRRPTRPYLNA
jgi:uncharacterized repeat protein (TIGR03943 family)